VATPPTRVQYVVPASGNFSGTATSFTTAALTSVSTGDLIVVMSSIENAGSLTTVTPSASGGSVTWTSRVAQTVGGINQSAAYCWTGAVGANASSVTITLARPSSDVNLWWGVTGTQWTAHGGVGTTFGGNNGTSSTAPSQAGAASCAANSAVQCTINDWSAADGTTRTWRTVNGSAQSESLYFRNATHHAAYGGYTADTGAAGAITQGLTTPSTMRWVLAGVEILGTGGAAAAPQPPLWHDQSVPRSATR
jgi:hypothetical protein